MFYLILVTFTNDIFTLFQMDQDENQKSDNKRRQSLSIDKAAFLLLRIKRVFKKRSQSHHIEKRFLK